jgi:hypothetical protein
MFRFATFSRASFELLSAFNSLRTNVSPRFPVLENANYGAPFFKALGRVLENKALLKFSCG